MKRNLAYSVRLFIAFALVGSGFVGSTLYANWRILEIEAETNDLLINVLPSMEHLSAASDVLRDLEGASDNYPDLPEAQLLAGREDIERRFRAFDDEIQSYLAFPSGHDERERYAGTVPAARRTLESALDRLFFAVEAHNFVEAKRIADHDIQPATARAGTHLRALSQLTSVQAHQRVVRINDIRQKTARSALLLDGASIGLGILAALWVLRLHQLHTNLLRVHSAMVEERANELELFGRRVAHDLLSPLSSLTFCLGAFKRASESDPKLGEMMVRARACVVRAQSMIDGIFAFARAGGQPDLHAHADVGEAIENTTEDMAMADAGQRPEITIEPFEPCEVTCNRGVLASIFMNLLRNAAKYMSDSAVKQIVIRILARGEHVRVEIEDTGPGVPRGLEEAIFEPYVRAAGVTQAGLGLGLATVKRLCEAHGGAVGVRSREAQGSLFWFMLPKAGRTAAAVRPWAAGAASGYEAGVDSGVRRGES